MILDEESWMNIRRFRAPLHPCATPIRASQHTTLADVTPSSSLPLSSSRSCRRTPGGTMRSAATNGPRDRSPIMAAPGKVAETGTAAASSRGGCRTGPPLYWPRMASPPSPRRAEPAFQRTRDAAFRAPRASRAAGSRGLNPAQPSRGRQCRQPGGRNGKANAADDDQPSA